MDQDRLQALEREVAAIRAQLTVLTAENAALRAERDQFRRFCDLSPNLIYLYDLDDRTNLYANRQIAESLGYSVEEMQHMRGTLMATIGHPEDMATMPEHIARLRLAADGDVLEVTYRCRRPDGSWRWLLSRDIVYGRDDEGVPRLILGIVEDVTERRRSEEELHLQEDEIARQAEEISRRDAERLALQEQVIEAHRVALRELSTPLIPIADRVVAMPLIGAIDGERAQRILEVLLQGITAQQAHIAILDVTGVRAADMQVADALVRVASTANLLGAEVVLTGISPALAQALTEGGVDLGATLTLATLQSGISYALRRAGGPVSSSRRQSLASPRPIR
ncbi:PAS domain-containing protein [Chondromyces apiculatus]|uniref:RsbR, positive regulator of sigma-B n=1 Tax=Chondromyces apiculatus DSM 436 TaxID=1192034 RepID=A0A017TB85_9BACT|nr:PAS domain-containing protein [Chondromyces apiculatus]EYF06177.1 RsbR, positive regulator of sigma-B [Chondromyces apiculatus DSM 436]